MGLVGLVNLDSMSSQKGQRYLFIDLLRFAAVVCMLQGHAFDALLKGSIKQTNYFYLHDFFHGFVAPVFLFASGLAFGVATFKNWEKYTSWSPSVRNRLVRFFVLILVGYGLHLPFFSLRKILYDSTPREIAGFLQVDALQCIAVSLLGLQLLVVVLRKEKRLALFSFWTAILMILLSPWVWQISFSRILPLGLASYINAENKSWFPLFPWASYLLLGTAFAYVFLRSQRLDKTAGFMKRATLSGLWVVGLGLALSFVPLDLLPIHDYWKVNPPVTLIRIGVLIVVTGAFYFFDQRCRIPLSFPTVVGRESLSIYVVHLMIIYGSVVSPGLVLNWGGQLNVIEVLSIFALVSLLLFTFAALWNHLKLNFRNWALLLKLATAATLIFSFVHRPY
jgi:uncharacterized membrane protein